MARRASSQKIEFGDWQTPHALAKEVVELLAREFPAPAAVVEPTCGLGAFLCAAHERWPAATLLGFDVNPAYAAKARAALGEKALIEQADFFSKPWEPALAALPRPLLILGNPPWVTASELGVLGAANLPKKNNFKGLRGLDAITGKSNFDVSEWMLLRLLAASPNHGCIVAMLCKTAVARKMLQHCAKHRLHVHGQLRSFDSKTHFNASVDAVLLIMDIGRKPERDDEMEWPMFAHIADRHHTSRLGLVEGILTGDTEAFKRTIRFAGSSKPEWRSGLKHDCASVMELTLENGVLRNCQGETVGIEPDLVFPLLKGSDVANGRLATNRRVLVPQRTLGQDTSHIRENQPRTWAYLNAHSAAMAARKSAIYQGQPSFSVFGVGDYTFSAWKVAICGLYKKLAFQLVGPLDGKPVIVDDTCYFLPFATRREAQRALSALTSNEASEFFESRIFWDCKRPISKSVLQALDWAVVGLEAGLPSHGEAPTRGELQLSLRFPTK